MFYKFKCMTKGDHYSVADRMKKKLHGLIVHAEIERPDGFTLRDADLLVHATKDGFELNPVYLKLLEVAEKRAKDYSKQFFAAAGDGGGGDEDDNNSGEEE
eukprot:6631181-Prymnesium_polylepis.1